MQEHIQALLESLPIMGYGMAGIFICIIVIMIFIFALSKLFPGNKEK